MSCVTTVILLLDVFGQDEADDIVTQVNAKMREADGFLHAEFRPLRPHFGGPKVPQIDAYGCAFSYLHCGELVELLRSFPWATWDEHAVVQIIVNGDGEIGARIFNVFGAPDATWEIETDFAVDADGNRWRD